MSLLKRTLSYAKPYKYSFGIAIVFNVFYAFANILSMVLIMPVMKILFNEEGVVIASKPIFSGKLLDIKDFLSDYANYQMSYLAETQGPIYLLSLSCILFICAFFLRNIFSYFSEYFLIDLRSGVSRDLRVDVHNKILELPISYFSERRKGDMLVRISSDVGEVEANILNGLIEILRSPVVIIVSIVALFIISYQLTLFTLLVFPIMGGIISLIGKSLKRDAGYAQNELSNIMSYVNETLSSLSIIKIFNAENQMKRRFDLSINRYRRFLQKVFRKRALASPMSEFLGSITIVLIIFFGGKLSLEGNGLSGSLFMVYIGTFYTLLDPIKRFSRSLSDIQKGQVSVERIFEVLDAEVEIKDRADAQAINGFNHKIEFKNVSFSYDNKPVIEKLNLTIEKGKTIALVGQSGSGKSTIANLITRFYDIKQGEILIDGINIKDIKLKDYRNLFGMVTQDSILFNDTVFENIALGSEKPEATEVERAAKVANAAEFIEKLPEKYQEVVGEGGGKLSGGQKQRLSIARAVFKNPPIMVLDEATSALDTQSEKWVQDALTNMMQNRTSLIIAHRLSTIQSADKIVVIDSGKIIEEGLHSELMDKKGVYANLIQLQSIK